MLDIGLDKVDTSILPSKGWSPGSPASAGERFSLELEAFRLGSLSNSQEMGRYRAYEDIITRVRDLTGEDIVNPMALSPRKIDRKHFNVAGAGQPSRNEQIQTLSEAIERAKEIDPTIPQIGDIEQSVFDKAKAAHNAAFRAGEVSSPWTGPAAFAGMMAGAMTDPANLATLPLGAPARLGGNVAIRTLKAMMVEGGIAAGTQAGIEVSTSDFKKASGIEDSSLANILAAGLGGAVLAGGLRGISELVASRAASKIGLTLDQLDSLAVAGRYADDVSSTPKGMDVEQHLDNLEAAILSVSRMEPITPQGSFSLVRGLPDIREERLLAIALEDEKFAAGLGTLGPDITPARADILARLEAVESQLKNPDLTQEARKKFLRRRDELLADTTPEALRSEAAVSAERRFMENARAKLNAEADKLRTEVALDHGWNPGPRSRGQERKAAALAEIIRVKEADPAEAATSALGEARRIAADTDPLVHSSDGRTMKASELLEQAAEARRVAEEISNACMLAGGGKV